MDLDIEFGVFESTDSLEIRGKKVPHEDINPFHIFMKKLLKYEPIYFEGLSKGNFETDKGVNFKNQSVFVYLKAIVKAFEHRILNGGHSDSVAIFNLYIVKIQALYRVKD